MPRGARIIGTYMSTLANSSATSRLLDEARGGDPAALPALFVRHQERLRTMVRLRLDPRVRGQITSAAVLEQVQRNAGRRLAEYQINPAQSFFLWLRRLTGECLQELHRQHLGGSDDAAGLCLYRGALPAVQPAGLAAQLLGGRTATPAVRAGLLLRLQEALNSMDPLDREVLALCHFEDLSEEEMAASLGMDNATATAHYLRALGRLTAILKSVPGFLG
jgi:RNA polymerase sigma-70 factor (ECF subfamily)